jgi:hypothetical protein
MNGPAYGHRWWMSGVSCSISICRLSFGGFDECSLVVIITPADGFPEPGALSIRAGKLQMTKWKMPAVAL